MKTIPIYIVIAFSLLSCKTTQYVPVETTKIEFKDKFIRDTIIKYDSIYIKDKGDTVFIEKYKYVYKNKTIRDSIFVKDTIRVPYPVKEVKNVKARLSSWQSFQIWTGRFALGLILIAIIYAIRKLIK